MIEEGVNGRLVSVDEADKLADAMKELISSPDEHARLERAGTGE
jgi:hypothetical protein